MAAVSSLSVYVCGEKKRFLRECAKTLLLFSPGDFGEFSRWRYYDGLASPLLSLSLSSIFYSRSCSTFVSSLFYFYRCLISYRPLNAFTTGGGGRTVPLISTWNTAIRKVCFRVWNRTMSFFLAVFFLAFPFFIIITFGNQFIIN